MHFRKLSNRDWKVIEERFEKKLSAWKVKLLTVEGRQVLINLMLSSLPMFVMSFLTTKRSVQKVELLLIKIFSQNDQHKKKI